MWVHDDGIICTIACYGIRRIIFLIVIVNPEDNIIVLIARDSVLQFSSRFYWVVLQFAFEVDGFTIWCPFAIAAASFDLVLGLKLESPLGTHISVEVVRFLQLPILLNNVLYHQWFIVITIEANYKMKPKLIFISYPILHNSAVEYNIITICIYSISLLCNKLCTYITEKRFIVSIYIYPLTYVLSLEASIGNTCVEKIDRFWLSNNVYNEQYICLLYKKCLIFRNLNSIKPFKNIIHIEFYVLSLYQHLTHCNISFRM